MHDQFWANKNPYFRKSTYIKTLGQLELEKDRNALKDSYTTNSKDASDVA